MFLLIIWNIFIPFQGKSGEAEPFCRRALAIVEKDRDSIDSGVAATCKNLAGMLEAQVRYISTCLLLRGNIDLVDSTRGRPYVFAEFERRGESTWEFMQYALSIMLLRRSCFKDNMCCS